MQVADGFDEDVIDGVIQLDGDARVSVTDATGRFQFGPATRPIGSLEAVTSTGAVFHRVDAESAEMSLRLQPFSYLEGVLRVRDRLAAGEKVKSWSWPSDGKSMAGTFGTFLVQRNRRCERPFSRSCSGK